MKRYIPHLLGALFVLIIMGAWALMSHIVSGKKQADQSLTQPTDTLVWDLWPDGMPDDNGLQGQTEELDWGTRLVYQPTLTVYPAAHPNGQVVLVCPGGGYWVVCHKHEGSDMAPWMNERGITLAVLRYRMPKQHDRIPLEDGQRAMELLREHADELHIRQIGVMGFSAGGHLASTIATHATTEANRPDFQILIYPVISMDTTITHMGSHDALIGEHPTEELTRLYSNELQVDSLTPPAFIALSGDDDLVPIANSLRYYQALQQTGVPAQLHMYPTNGHGWGFNETPFHLLWKQALADWLNKLL